MYVKIPFGFMNVGCNCYKAMDIAFAGEKEMFVVICLYDIIIFSSSDEEHLKHLQKTIKKCRRYGLSLDPKKYHLVLKEGKLLGNIVSKEGVKIYPKRVEAIKNIPLPSKT